MAFITWPSYQIQGLTSRSSLYLFEILSKKGTEQKQTMADGYIVPSKTSNFIQISEPVVSPHLMLAKHRQMLTFRFRVQWKETQSPLTGISSMSHMGSRMAWTLTVDIRCLNDATISMCRAFHQRNKRRCEGMSMSSSGIITGYAL